MERLTSLLLVLTLTLTSAPAETGGIRNLGSAPAAHSMANLHFDRQALALSPSSNHSTFHPLWPMLRDWWVLNAGRLLQSAPNRTVIGIVATGVAGTAFIKFGLVGGIITLLGTGATLMAGLPGHSHFKTAKLKGSREFSRALNAASTMDDSKIRIHTAIYYEFLCVAAGITPEPDMAALALRLVDPLESRVSSLNPGPKARNADVAMDETARRVIGAFNLRYTGESGEKKAGNLQPSPDPNDMPYRMEMLVNMVGSTHELFLVIAAKMAALADLTEPGGHNAERKQAELLYDEINDIYAPLAEWLSMPRVTAILLDESFLRMDSGKYKHTRDRMEESLMLPLRRATNMLERLGKKITKKLRSELGGGQALPRIKSVRSTYNKWQAGGEVEDLLGMQIVLSSPAQLGEALAMLLGEIFFDQHGEKMDYSKLKIFGAQAFKLYLHNGSPVSVHVFPDMQAKLNYDAGLGSDVQAHVIYKMRQKLNRKQKRGVRLLVYDYKLHDPVGNFRRLKEITSRYAYVIVQEHGAEVVYRIPSHRDDKGRTTHGNVVDLAFVRGEPELHLVGGALITSPARGALRRPENLPETAPAPKMNSQVLNDGDVVRFLTVDPYARLFATDAVMNTMAGASHYLQLLQYRGFHIEKNPSDHAIRAHLAEWGIGKELAKTPLTNHAIQTILEPLVKEDDLSWSDLRDLLGTKMASPGGALEDMWNRIYYSALARGNRILENSTLPIVAEERERLAGHFSRGTKFVGLTVALGLGAVTIDEIEAFAKKLSLSKKSSRGQRPSRLTARERRAGRLWASLNAGFIMAVTFWALMPSFGWFNQAVSTMGAFTFAGVLLALALGAGSLLGWLAAKTSEGIHEWLGHAWKAHRLGYFDLQVVPESQPDGEDLVLYGRKSADMPVSRIADPEVKRAGPALSRVTVVVSAIAADAAFILGIALLPAVFRTPMAGMMIVLARVLPLGYLAALAAAAVAHSFGDREEAIDDTEALDVMKDQNIQFFHDQIDIEGKPAPVVVGMTPGREAWYLQTGPFRIFSRALWLRLPAHTRLRPFRFFVPGAIEQVRSLVPVLALMTEHRDAFGEKGVEDVGTNRGLLSEAAFSNGAGNVLGIDFSASALSDALVTLEQPVGSAQPRGHLLDRSGWKTHTPVPGDRFLLVNDSVEEWLSVSPSGRHQLTPRPPAIRMVNLSAISGQEYNALVDETVESSTIELAIFWGYNDLSAAAAAADRFLRARWTIKIKAHGFTSLSDSNDGASSFAVFAMRRGNTDVAPGAAAGKTLNSEDIPLEGPSRIENAAKGLTNVRRCWNGIWRPLRRYVLNHQLSGLLIDPTARKRAAFYFSLARCDVADPELAVEIRNLEQVALLWKDPLMQNIEKGAGFFMPLSDHRIASDLTNGTYRIQVEPPKRNDTWLLRLRYLRGSSLQKAYLRDVVKWILPILGSQGERVGSLRLEYEHEQELLTIRRVIVDPRHRDDELLRTVMAEVRNVLPPSTKIRRYLNEERGLLRKLFLAVQDEIPGYPLFKGMAVDQFFTEATTVGSCYAYFVQMMRYDLLLPPPNEGERYAWAAKIRRIEDRFTAALKETQDISWEEELAKRLAQENDKSSSRRSEIEIENRLKREHLEEQAIRLGLNGGRVKLESGKGEGLYIVYPPVVQPIEKSNVNPVGEPLHPGQRELEFGA